MQVYKHILNIIQKKGACYLILIDPDEINKVDLTQFVIHCEKSGVDGFLVGGSLSSNAEFNQFLYDIKSITELPIIIFPGSEAQLSSYADGVLFLSVLSGRNPEHLIGKHVIAAPIIRSLNIEPISTGYLLIDSGNTTTAQYMSASIPIPRNKSKIAVATALAGEYLGMKLIYLEGGSGAIYPVPNEMIKEVASSCTVPVAVGGGIKSAQVAREKVEAGAKIIVTGNYFQNKNNWALIKEFAQAVHFKNIIEV